jgi:hypothetical protein
MAQGAAVITKLDCRQPAAKNLQQSSAPVEGKSCYASQPKIKLSNITKLVSKRQRAGKTSNKTKATKLRPGQKPSQDATSSDDSSESKQKEGPIKPNQLQKQSNVHVFAVQPNGKNERATSKPQISAQPRQQGQKPSQTTSSGASESQSKK